MGCKTPCRRMLSALCGQTDYVAFGVGPFALGDWNDPGEAMAVPAFCPRPFVTRTLLSIFSLCSIILASAPLIKGVGISAGGVTLLHLAAKQPERVKAMVIVSATPYFPARARTMIIQGDRDPLYPVEISSEMAKATPNSALWIVPNAGHGPVIGERWLEFIETAAAFLRG